MSDSRVGATLTYAGTAKPPTTAVVPVDSAGLVLALDVPAGVALSRAALTVQAPGDDLTVDLTPVAALTTNLGKSTLGTDKVQWLSLDWNARRPLMSLELQPKSTTQKGRLSVAEGGPWYPPTPSDTVPIGSVVPLPGLFASRLLVEFVDAASTTPVGTPKTLVDTALTSVAVRAAARPPDLSAMLGTGSLFFHQAMPLLPRQELVLGDALSSALQRAWPPELRGGALNVTLRSSGLGMLERVQLTLDTLAVVQTWSGGEGVLSLPVATDGQAAGLVAVPPDRALSEVRFAVRYQPKDERLPLAPQPPETPPLSHRCGSGYSAAQAFSTSGPEEALVGLDLHVRPLTRSVKATLSLYADVHDRPGDVPLMAAAVELVLEEKGPPPWKARWVSFEPLKPVALPSATWWAVLTVTEGDLLWSLSPPLTGSAAAQPLVPGIALYRSEAAGPWLARDTSLSAGQATGTSWAYARPRLRATASAPPPAPEVRLRWGTRVLDVSPSEDGSVALDAKALAALTPPGGTGSAPPLEVLVRSRVAGVVTLSGLRVTSPRSETYALFPRK